jgi:methyl-accepting chemotaxis protein
MKSARGRKSNKVTQVNDDHALLDAINQAQPFAQYDMDGTVLEVNKNFESLIGLNRDEMIGQHVSIFVDEKTRASSEYKSALKTLWDKLRDGQACVGEGKRTTAHGKEISCF